MPKKEAVERTSLALKGAMTDVYIAFEDRSLNLGPPRPRVPWRAIISLTALLLLSLGSLGTGARAWEMGAAKRRKQQDKAQQQQQPAALPAPTEPPGFVPKEGLDAFIEKGMVIRPVPPGGPLQSMVPALVAANQPPEAGVTCIFSYGPMLLEDGVRDEFLREVSSTQDALLYGMVLSGRLAFPTGFKGDTLAGQLFCFPPDIFPAKLKAADDFRGYDASKPEQSAIRRAVVPAVNKQGDTLKAYLYFRLEGKKKKEKPGFFGAGAAAPSAGGGAASGQSQFASFSATSLHCNTCAKAMPVKEEVSENKDKPGYKTFEYKCATCDTVVGRRDVQI
eukprot:g62110.t1